MQILHHLHVVRRGVVPRIDQHENVRDVFLHLEEIVQRFRPLFLFALRHAREPVAGKIGKDKFSEIEVVDKARAPGLATRFCKLLPIRQHIDKRAFPHVRFTANGDHRLIRDNELLLLRRGRDKRRVLDRQRAGFLAVFVFLLVHGIVLLTTNVATAFGLGQGQNGFFRPFFTRNGRFFGLKFF